MKCFGLTPENFPDPAQEAHIRSPGRSFSMLYGSVSFGTVSVLAYSIWAYRLVPGTAAMYATIGSAGRLLWGAAHGLGFGAGLGYLLFHCQRRRAETVSQA